MKSFGIAATCVVLSGPLAAEQYGAYYMGIDPQDLSNSNGVSLRDLGAVIQQDRANFHRFGRPGPHDQGDGFFGNAETRALIPGLVAAFPRNIQWFGTTVSRPGNPSDADLLVMICGSGGRLTHIVLDYANGDGYSDC